MHPITFFVQDATIDALVERFGCYLERLDRCQKIQIRVLLTTFLMGQDMMGDNYTIGDAWEDASMHAISTDDDVIAATDILSELTIPQAEGLLAALAEQCTVGNARIKTPIDTAVEAMEAYGIPHALAVAATIILVEVDGVRYRTPEEQATIEELWRRFPGNFTFVEAARGE